MRRIALLALGLALAACASQEPERVGATGPTVTYRFFGDADGDQFQDAVDRADTYCDDKYDRKAMLLKLDRDGGANTATFQCA